MSVLSPSASVLARRERSTFGSRALLRRSLFPPSPPAPFIELSVLSRFPVSFHPSVCPSYVLFRQGSQYFEHCAGGITRYRVPCFFPAETSDRGRFHVALRDIGVTYTRDVPHNRGRLRLRLVTELLSASTRLRIVRVRRWCCVHRTA